MPRETLEQRRTRVAYHEAGHAVVAERLGLVLIGVRITPKGYGGQTRTGWYMGPPPAPLALLVNCAGRQAEEIFLGRCVRVTWDDRTLRALASNFEKDSNYRCPGGPDDDCYTVEILMRSMRAPSPDRCIRALRRFESRARKMLENRTNWDLVERLAAALVARSSLDGRQAKNAMYGWSDNL